MTLLESSVTPEKQEEQLLYLGVALACFVVVLVAFFLVLKVCRRHCEQVVFSSSSPEEVKWLPSCRNTLKVRHGCPRAKPTESESSPLLQGESQSDTTSAAVPTEPVQFVYDSWDNLLSSEEVKAAVDGSWSVEMSDASSSSWERGKVKQRDEREQNGAKHNCDSPIGSLNSHTTVPMEVDDDTTGKTDREHSTQDYATGDGIVISVKEDPTNSWQLVGVVDESEQRSKREHSGGSTAVGNQGYHHEGSQSAGSKWNDYSKRQGGDVLHSPLLAGDANQRSGECFDQIGTSHRQEVLYPPHDTARHQKLVYPPHGAPRPAGSSQCPTGVGHLRTIVSSQTTDPIPTDSLPTDDSTQRSDPGLIRPGTDGERLHTKTHHEDNQEYYSDIDSLNQEHFGSDSDRHGLGLDKGNLRQKRQTSQELERAKTTDELGSTDVFRHIADQKPAYANIDDLMAAEQRAGQVYSGPPPVSGRIKVPPNEHPPSLKPYVAYTPPTNETLESISGMQTSSSPQTGRSDTHTCTSTMSSDALMRREIRETLVTTESRTQPALQRQYSESLHSQGVAQNSNLITDANIPCIHQAHDNDKKKKELKREGVSKPFLIEVYAATEWKGSTTKAKKMLRGYQLIPRFIKCSELRRIRGDNYCAIRAAIFQALVTGLPILKRLSSPELKEVPKKLVAKGCDWLCKWSFANRRPDLKDARVLDSLEDCLQSLLRRATRVVACHTNEDRVQYVMGEFSGDNSGADVAMMEAVKLLMLEQAVQLFRQMQQGKEVPMWVYILFARDTSTDPHELMTHHLNNVGDTGGLEQVEMFLLGYTLEATLQVFRPSQVDAEDFVSRYPDDLGEDSPVLLLVAEDDRHYNIIATDSYHLKQPVL